MACCIGTQCLQNCSLVENHFKSWSIVFLVFQICAVFIRVDALLDIAILIFQYFIAQIKYHSSIYLMRIKLIQYPLCRLRQLLLANRMAEPFDFFEFEIGKMVQMPFVDLSCSAEGNHIITRSMIHQHWRFFYHKDYLTFVLQIEGFKKHATESYHSRYLPGSSQSISQTYCTTLTKSSHKNSFQNILFILFNSAFLPIVDLLSNILIQSLKTFFDLINVVPYLFRNRFRHLPNIIPTRHGHAPVDGDRPDGCMQKFDSTSFEDRRLGHLKEIKKAS